VQHGGAADKGLIASACARHARACRAHVHALPGAASRRPARMHPPTHPMHAASTTAQRPQPRTCCRTSLRVGSGCAPCQSRSQTRPSGRSQTQSRRTLLLGMWRRVCRQAWAGVCVLPCMRGRRRQLERPSGLAVPAHAQACPRHNHPPAVPPLRTRARTQHAQHAHSTHPRASWLRRAARAWWGWVGARPQASRCCRRTATQSRPAPAACRGVGRCVRVCVAQEVSAEGGVCRGWQPAHKRSVRPRHKRRTQRQSICACACAFACACACTVCAAQASQRAERRLAVCTPTSSWTACWHSTLRAHWTAAPVHKQHLSPCTRCVRASHSAAHTTHRDTRAHVDAPARCTTR
jgi:hypothetical protein